MATEPRLELLAVQWLRFEKRCPVALFERSPRPHHGQPDVLGITRDRHLFEIEIKRSLQDFRANNQKHCIKQRNALLQSGFEAEMWPRLYWFLVPHDLVEKVQPELPDWAGLLRGPKPNESHCCLSVVPAPQNKASKRLTTREMVRLAHCMANQIYSDVLHRYNATTV